MKTLRWSSEKDERPKAERGNSFEDILVATDSCGLLDILSHPNPAKYPERRILVVAQDGYAHLMRFPGQEGIPSHTLDASLPHEYVTGLWSSAIARPLAA